MNEHHCDALSIRILTRTVALLTFVCVAVLVNISYSAETGKLVRLQILCLYVPFHFDILVDFMKRDVKFYFNQCFSPFTGCVMTKIYKYISSTAILPSTANTKISLFFILEVPTSNLD